MDAQTRPQVLGNRCAIPTSAHKPFLGVFRKMIGEEKKNFTNGQRPANDRYPSALGREGTPLPTVVSENSGDTLA